MSDKPDKTVIRAWARLMKAQQRALAWMAQYRAPESARNVALDEIFGHDRQGAYLSIVDTVSWAVWASAAERERLRQLKTCPRLWTNRERLAVLRVPLSQQ